MRTKKLAELGYAIIEVISLLEDSMNNDNLTEAEKMWVLERTERKHGYIIRKVEENKIGVV